MLAFSSIRRSSHHTPLLDVRGRMATPALIAGQRTFRQSTTTRMALAVLLFLPLGIAWSLVDDPNPTANPGLMWITAATAVVYMALCVVIGKTILTISEQGVRRETVFGVQEIPWSQIKETRYLEKPVRVGAHFGIIGMMMSAAAKSAAKSSIVLTVISSDGGFLKVTSNFRQAKDAANAILAQILPAMLAATRSRLRRGETVRFGTIALTSTDLAWKSQPGVPLPELASAEIVGADLKIKCVGKWRNFISIRSDKVPDVFVLLELLDEMAPQLRQKLDPLARVRG